MVKSFIFRKVSYYSIRPAVTNWVCEWQKKYRNEVWDINDPCSIYPTLKQFQTIRDPSYAWLWGSLLGRFQCCTCPYPSTPVTRLRKDVIRSFLSFEKLSHAWEEPSTLKCEDLLEAVYSFSFTSPCWMQGPLCTSAWSPVRVCWALPQWGGRRIISLA